MNGKSGNALEDRDLAVRVLPYDGKAPLIFEHIRQFIRNVVPYPLEVEHVGSTSVAGLGGKGIIDILIVTNRENITKIVEMLESKGYEHNAQADTIPEKLFVSGPYKYSERELHIHIHTTFFGSKEHREKLLFRDFLRRHPKEAETYFKLKKQASREAGSDGTKYTELKKSYINEVLEKARKKEEQM
jgi:GrpB-like predicted nucleotidyltransferase (UPF0157 family)